MSESSSHNKVAGSGRGLLGLAGRVLVRAAYGRATAPQARLWAICARLCGVAVVFLLWRAGSLSYNKAYAIDEFYYVHLSWTASQSAYHGCRP